MSPPGPLATARTGVSTSPTTGELKALARVVLANIGADFGVNKVNRLVSRFVQAMPSANGWAFFLYLANAVQMSAEQQRRALSNPDISRVIAYADPTGETAVNNVIRRR